MVEILSVLLVIRTEKQEQLKLYTGWARNWRLSWLWFVDSLDDLCLINPLTALLFSGSHAVWLQRHPHLTVWPQLCVHT